MQRQQRQQQAAQGRQQAQDTQRQAQQSQQQRQAQQNAAAQRGSFGANAGADRRTFSNGVSKSNQPPTTAQLAKGYTGKQTPDGRALVKFQGRVLAVPASRIGVKPRQPANDGGAPSASSTSWTTKQRATVRADVQKLAGSPPGGGGSGKGGSAGGSNGGLSSTFNAAARARVEAARVARMGQGAQMAGVVRGNSREENLKYDTPKAREEGWRPPHSTGSNFRSYVSQRTERFVRVWHETENKKVGGFMVREKEIAHLGNDPEKIQAHLGLKQAPTHIAVLEVPPNTKMQMSVIGENFERKRAGGFQYIVTDTVSEDWFKSTRKLEPSPVKH
ncbi:hypothetical protein CDN99_22020 [Roseateles aquatilis]|uniref:Uncharacterized protein n=2 Tax=Roseateles aquatilis TaxID=431061 RepID=A0A2D0ALW6_9BURK|nr:hypothetical protein CDN99_22020 [Roseateles aquatilis]